jgi:hypothetical protein
MKVKSTLAATLLTLVFAVPSLGGNIGSPGGTPPPPTTVGNIGSPGSSMSTDISSAELDSSELVNILIAMLSLI